MENPLQLLQFLGLGTFLSASFLRTSQSLLLDRDDRIDRVCRSQLFAKRLQRGGKLVVKVAANQEFLQRIIQTACFQFFRNRIKQLARVLGDANNRMFFRIGDRKSMIVTHGKFSFSQYRFSRSRLESFEYTHTWLL